MCMVSMVMDGYQPWKKQPDPPIVYPQTSQIITWINGVPREEFDKLKREVEELRELLKAAIKFDKNTGQPDCHNDEKIALLKAMAKALGIDLQDVFASES